MPEASLRQPCARLGCVFPATPLDSGGPPPIKLLPRGAFPQASHNEERSSPREGCRCLPTPNQLQGRNSHYVVHR